jgi:uroporphyrinogen-III synthase
VNPSFDNRAVLILESRRSKELATLVTNYGGRPVSAPALKEVPLDANPEALAFAGRLIRGEFDLVVLLTGVGTRALLEAVERAHPREQFVAALARTTIAVRGPKPLAVMRELKVPVSVIAPEPNTWRELLAALGDINGLRVAVQEYGVPNADLIAGLEERGARVTRVPVYRWALPDDLAPLKDAVAAVARGEIDVALFTTGMQVVHLFQVAASMGQEDALRDGLRRALVASIGPTTSEQLREHDLQIDLEASHPKMGFLVREAAEKRK